MSTSPQQKAKELLPKSTYDYYAGAAGSECTYAQNQQSLVRINFLPRSLTDVTKVSANTTVQNLPPLSMPLLIAPMAMQKMAHPAGELAVAGAAKRHNVPYVLSTFATTSIEDVAAVGASCLLQLYVFKMRNISLSLVRRAERAGFKGIILTLDAPRLGSRKRDHNNSFKLPSHLELANFSTLHFENTQAANTSMLQTQFDPQLETDLSVSTLKWLLANTTLPVWAKGILRPDDAQRAVTAGIAGIIVSNHGGRQLDGTISSISALPHVVRAVRGRVPVLFDSGVRTGEDVVRAIALGASAVLLGRPVLWALAGGGEEAVHQLLNTFRTDIELAMCLCGARYVSEITRDLVVLPGDDLCRQCGDMRAKL